MSRRALLIVLSLLTLLPAAGAEAATRASWNRDEQRTVREAGLMHDYVDAAFHGDRPFAPGQLRAAMSGLAAQLNPLAPAPVATPSQPVSVRAFNALLVRQLGAQDVADHVQHEAFGAGLQPPKWFGTEVVARFLGLRTNHPFPDEELELYPWEPITRAEAAHSLAVAIKLGPGAAQWARDTFARFILPPYGPRTRQVLRIAVQRIGMPYVWGGETDTASAYLGGQEHGGYDCSGLVWRVFKLAGLPAGAAIRGRTAAAQAAEMRRSERISLADVRPADLLFFGPGRFWQKATERRIVHEGIALSADWMIHASAQGVYVSPLFDEWRAKRFSWARRVL
jgi:cell wall-associated NlpC family hydrolase